MTPRTYPDPPPMPGVREALLDVIEARKALERAEKAWNATQLEDALRSASFFIEKARVLCEHMKPCDHVWSIRGHYEPGACVKCGKEP